MRKAKKLYALIILLALAIVLASDALVVNLTAPVPSPQVVSAVEHNPEFEAETQNSTYSYLGYDNGRTSPIHCGPVSVYSSSFGSLVQVFWPPPRYGSVTLVFAVDSNSSSSKLPFPSGILYVRANPYTGVVYGLSFKPLCL